MASTLKLNIAGFRELRKSPKVEAFVKAKAEAVARRAGPGFEAEESPSKNRARYTVFPVTAEAVEKNAEENTLIRALHG